MFGNKERDFKIAVLEGQVNTLEGITRRLNTSSLGSITQQLQFDALKEGVKTLKNTVADLQETVQKLEKQLAPKQGCASQNVPVNKRLDFSAALRALKDGKKVRLPHWDPGDCLYFGFATSQAYLHVTKGNEQVTPGNHPVSRLAWEAILVNDWEVVE